VQLTGPNVEGKRPTVVTAFTGPDGKFQLMAPPAAYTALVQRPGYYGAAVNGVWPTNVTRTITLTAGRQTEELKFSLMPSGVIAGRLSDANGRPLASMTVGALQVRYQDGRPIVTQVRSADTNELGEYRIYWVPPGDYVVAFTPGSTVVATPVLASTSDPRSIHTRTYYPGTTELAGAHAVSVTQGKEVDSLNFGVRTTKTFNISGRVVNPYAAAPGPGTAETSLLELPGFILVNRDVVGAPEITMSTFANASSPADRQAGLFELRSIPVGRYDLYSQLRTPAFATTFLGRVTVDLLTRDLTDVVITVRPPVELRGKILSDGSVKLPEKAIVKLRSTESTRVSPPAESPVDANGEFTFKSVTEGLFRMEVSLPENASLEDIRQGDRSIYSDGLIRVSQDAPTALQIVLASNAGSVSGSVAHPEGKSGVDTTVVAVPDGSFRNNTMLYSSARVEASGQFTVNNIAPGKYKLFAFEGVMNSAWMNPEWLSKYEDSGVPLTIAPGKVTGIKLPAVWTK
jgi:hypothetical protein